MTYVKTTYVALNEDGKPIASAENLKDIQEGLDIYFGVDKALAECLGFFPYITKYPDDYEGYIEYKYQHNEKEEVEKIKIYCVDFFPRTIYEKN